ARALANTQYAALGVLTDDGSQLKQFITSGMEPQIARQIDHEPRGEGLLGDIFKSGHAIRVDHIPSDARSSGFCSNHPQMTTFLGVPITNRGKHIGNLYLCDRIDGQPFDDQDEELLTLLAAHAAIAIENARLHGELQSAALRSERDRIGMELHDGVIQSIYAVGMKIEIIQNRLQVSPDQREQFGLVMEDLNKIIEDVRSYIRNLLTAHDEKTTLKTYIENLIAHFRDFSGVNVVFSIADDVPMLSDFQRHNLLQILRESLANVAHHADATTVEIEVIHEHREVVMRISDDGQGFDANAIDRSAEGHYGLQNIVQRARRLGGMLEIDSSPGGGTTVTLHMPLKLDFTP
ncbi:MAG: GAF domain-containing sensor histidine kinase, partial [Anaerolineales bacterium]